MSVSVREERPPDWRAYAAIPIRFEARVVLDARARPGGFDLHERPLAAPTRKDYDARPADHPLEWPRRFDVSRWGVLVAHLGPERVGAAVVAVDTQGVDMLEGRADLAVLWDVRVGPAWRGRRVGAALFGAAAEWARARGKAELKVETQDVNPAACRFYQAMGCELRRVVPGAYPTLPDEVQLLWFKRLTR